LNTPTLGPKKVDLFNPPLNPFYSQVPTENKEKKKYLNSMKMLKKISKSCK